MPDGSSQRHAHGSEPQERPEPAWGFAYVVVPVLRCLFAAGEVASVRVVAEQTGEGRELWLHLDALGDSGSSVLWDSVSTLREASLTELRIRLADQVHDLIAESPHGWGQLRPFTRSDFE